MKKIILSTGIFLLSITIVNAQTAAKSIFVELGGPGLASLNYDMRLQKKEDGLGFRVGVGGFTINENYGNGNERSGLLTIPVALNYLLSKDQRNYFEIGAGATYVHLSNKSQNFDNEQFSTSFGHLHFGYRLQPVNGGFTFRAGITPIFNGNGFIPYYASLSFGYKF
ncbi:MAG: hypothetical protein JWQ27_2967 [Ferruginibacter sp.]|nr:hypothetical protein [Ferruginibacter sp.]